MKVEVNEVALQQARERRFLIDGADAWLFDEIRPHIGQRVLEIGCGLGNLARYLLDREEYVGIESSDEVARQFADMFSGHPNVRALVADASDSAFLDLGRQRFDTIISLNVFEHIEHDARAMYHAFELLRPGGKFALVVPAHQWLYGTMDRAIGHHRRYQKTALVSLLTGLGFHCLDARYLNALGALGWLVNGRVFRQRIPPARQLKLFNRVVPLIRAAEGIVTPPFGVSILVIAQRPGRAVAAFDGSDASLEPGRV